MRLNSAPLLFVLVLAAPGCLAHERPGPILLDAAPLGRDGGLVPPVADAASATCTLDETSIAIEMVPVTLDVARCDVTHAENVTLSGVDPDPATNGVRVHFDLCPAADADCRCDVVVSGIGTDVAAMLGPEPSVVVDLATGSGFVPGAFLAITKPGDCACAGCGCAEPLYLYAGNVSPEAAPLVPASVVFSRGAAGCPNVDCTYAGSWLLHARALGIELDVPGGATRTLGPVLVRSLRDVEIFAPCRRCDTCDQPLGAFVAWVPRD